MPFHNEVKLQEQVWLSVEIQAQCTRKETKLYMIICNVQGTRSSCATSWDEYQSEQHSPFLPWILCCTLFWSGSFAVHFFDLDPLRNITAWQTNKKGPVFSSEFTDQRAQLIPHDHAPHLECSDCKYQTLVACVPLSAKYFSIHWVLYSDSSSSSSSGHWKYVGLGVEPKGTMLLLGQTQRAY